jgi:sulfite reductase alpha subunit-like flavoprotein
VLALNPEEEKMINAMIRWEGMTIDEAKLSYQARKDLPNSVFCGPDRTYPAHNARHVRAAFQRLSQFGHRLSSDIRGKIVRCLTRRAKTFGIEHDPKSYKWNSTGERNGVHKKNTDETVKWFLARHGIKSKCEECEK